uniref:CARD domain-containing protein n=1 Tax=Seriola dumerili TaxID=41447 RepID=A0A3B4UXT3_SERDU
MEVSEEDTKLVKVREHNHCTGDVCVCIYTSPVAGYVLTWSVSWWQYQLDIIWLTSTHSRGSVTKLLERGWTFVSVFLQFVSLVLWSFMSGVYWAVSYRFRCPGPGGFQCTLTGLVFVVAQEAELLYRTVQWDESLLQSAGKTPAGPLFNIQCPEEAVCELHLPHCETKDDSFDLNSNGLLSVVHISDDGLSILEPLKVTDTHVVVKVPHLSAFGLVWDTVKRFLNIKLPVNGQVLLFVRPPDPWPPVLDVFLLQNNIPVSEVKLCISADCKLSIGQTYSVHCEPEDVEIQPEFYSKYGPNFHPTFEVFLTSDPKKVTVMVQDKKKTEVWKRSFYLPGKEDSLPAEDRLFLVRTQFINRVSDALLNQLLDKLLERGVVTDDEMQSARTKTRAEKARDVIDTVRRKGTEASSVLIAALYEVDQCLSRVLALR